MRHDDFHPEVDDFHPVVGYLLPSRAFRRTVRMAAFAAAIGAIVGAGATASLLKPRIPDASVRPPDAAQPMEAGPGEPETAPPATSNAFVQLARRPCGSRTARFDTHCRAGGEPDPILVEETSTPDQAAALPHPSDPPTSAARETAAQKTASPKKPKIVDATKLKPFRDIYYNARDAYASPFWAGANSPTGIASIPGRSQFIGDAGRRGDH